MPSFNDTFIDIRQSRLSDAVVNQSGAVISHTKEVMQKSLMPAQSENPVIHLPGINRLTLISAQFWQSSRQRQVCNSLTEDSLMINGT